MEKVTTETPSIEQDNIERLVELFPQVATEVQNEDGQVRRAVDFDALRDLLGDVAEGQRERYQFTWPGKRDAKVEARRVIDKTMIPCKEESVDWDTTENLYIEGDNLDALKLLRETYAGKVKMVYIDPPYNTGNDFVYDDDYAKTHAEYIEESGEYSEEGGRLVANPESNGKFHSDWCSMIYPRLLLAKDLMANDGVIFISIGENEVSNLQKICDDIFGHNSFITSFIWEKTQHFGRQKLNYYNNADYVLCYTKSNSSEGIRSLLVERVKTELEDAPLYNASNNINDLSFPKGTVKFNLSDGTYAETTSEDYVLLNKVIVKDGINDNDFALRFKSRWSNSTVQSEIEKGTTFWVKTQNFAIRAIYGAGKQSRESPRQILFTNTGNPSCTYSRFAQRIDTSENATSELKSLMGVTAFSYPKPVSLIEYFISLMWNESEGCYLDDFIVLDFFAGSSTTGHAIMNVNEKDKGRRKFILVQLPEAYEEDAECFGAYKNLCDAGIDRLKRAGRLLSSGGDVGFRVLKIESSNFKDTYANPQETTQTSLLGLVDNLKEGRSGEDLLFQVLPKFRIPYSAHIETRDIFGKTVFNVEDGQLVACFDIDVTNDVITEIAKMQPSYAVMRDLSFKNDAAQANFEEIFKTFSPDTIRRVI